MQVFRLLVALSTISLIIFSCGTKGEDSDKSVFRFNQVSVVSSLDPAFARIQSNIWPVNQLYNGLVQFSNDLQIMPSIAKRWEISPDGLEYEFHLRNDVYFHSCEDLGQNSARKVIASDFVYSFERIMDPQVASPGAWIFNDKVAQDTPFTAIDDTTFVVKLHRPFRPMMGIFTMQYCFVVQKEAVEFYGKEFRRNPVGTGPFQFKSWVEGESLIMTSNPSYFEYEGDQQLPYLDEVLISFIDNMSTEFLALLDGDLDFVSDIDASLKDRVLSLEGDLKPSFTDKIKLIRAPYLNTEYLGIRMQYEDGDSTNPLLIKEVRQAINHGFDREQMVRFLKNNKGKAALSGMIPYGMPSFDESAFYGYQYDVEKAAALLSSAGYPGGKGLPSIPLYAPPTYMDICEFLQHQLSEIGINLEIKITQFGILRNMMETGEATFFRGSWIADYPDAESYMAMFYGKHGAPPNYTGFRNSFFDELYEKAAGTNDDYERYRLYQTMDSLVMDESVVIPLYYDEVYRFTGLDVKGLEANPMNLLSLKRVQLN